VDAALAALPSEPDEQIAARLMGQVARALDGYVAVGRAADRRATAEALFLRRASDTTLGYGLRKSFFDTYVGLARTPAALSRLDAWLDSASAAGMPLRQPTRWSVVTTLIARGATNGESRLARELARDTTTGGKRRAFVAGAAFARADVKRSYFDRYFRDSTLNEEWVTASLGAFNVTEQGALTLPYLRPALDTLPWIQRNRRIFFLGSWLNAFIGGQRSAEALAEVDRYLAEHPQLPRDLRLKVLQARDDLERTVRIRRAFP
jgi:aminopeptidase N